MSKLTKIMHKIFGINADFSYQMGKFGSFKAGSPAYAANVTDIQELSNFEEGLYGSVVGSNAPLLEDFNSALHHSSRQIGYLYQAGIPEWDTDSVYYKGSAVQYSEEYFVSLSDANTGKIPNIANATDWVPLTSKNLFVDYSNNSGQTINESYPPQIYNFPTLNSDTKNLVANESTSWEMEAPYTGYYDVTGYISTVATFASGDHVYAYYDDGLITYLLFDFYPNSVRNMEMNFSKKIKLIKGNKLAFKLAMVRTGGDCAFFGNVIVAKTDI